MPNELQLIGPERLDVKRQLDRDRKLADDLAEALDLYILNCRDAALYEKVRPVIVRYGEARGQGNPDDDEEREERIPQLVTAD